MVVSDTEFFVSQNAHFSLTSYLYQGVSLRSQAGVVLACARLEAVNPVVASYVNGITFTEFVQFAPAFVLGGDMDNLIYPVLDEIGTSTSTCIDASRIFDPWTATAQCNNSGITLDQCPIGDLRGHAMAVRLFAGATVLQSPLTGQASIIGHAVGSVHIIVFNCTYIIL